MKIRHATSVKNRLKKRKNFSESKKTIFYTIAEATPEEQAAFIRKTYLHLAGMLAAFVILVAFFLTSGFAQNAFYSITNVWYFLFVMATVLASFLIA